MVDDIRILKAAKPFAPFTVYTSDGSALRVPTVDRVAVLPAGSRVLVFGDHDEFRILSPDLISRVSVDGDGVSQPSA
jgi:hypothetical protein